MERTWREADAAEISKILITGIQDYALDLCEIGAFLGRRSWVNVTIRAGEPLDPRYKGQ